MRTTLAALVGLLITSSVSADQPASPQLLAGAATSNITPPLGGKIVGGFLPIPSTHIHDELHARCLLLDDGQVRLALVVCDLLGMDRCVSDEARRLIQERLALPPERVLICATHTHSASSALGQDRYDVEQEPDEYQHFVAGRIADGVHRAANLLRPASIAFGTAAAPEHVFNRRWHMKPGSIPPNPFDGLDQVQMNPPAGSPNLMEPAGPTDPTVSFLAVRQREGRPLALFASYSLHYVGGVPSTEISADYFGMFCNRVAELQGAERQDPPFVAMLANGTSGDINNIDFLHPRGSKQPYEQMRTVANDVAAKVHAALGSLGFREHVSLDARYREVPIATRRPTPELLQWARQTLEQRPLVEGRADLPRVYAERTLGMAELPETMAQPLQVLRIGDVCLGTMPCEVFCEIGLEFKERSPLQPAMLISLAHGYNGYLPTPRHHRLGGYETWLGTNRLEADASDKMLAALLEMAAEMK